MKIFRRWKLVLFLTFIFITVFFGWYYIFGFKSGHPGAYFNKGTNAVWLGHRWVDEGIKDEEIADLVLKLKANQIKYVFVHVGPIESDGTIPSSRYRAARDFVYTAHSLDSDIVYEAWMGQLREKLDLSRGEIRGRIADTAYNFIHEIGFDGVHLNIEPMRDGDSEMLFLAKDIRERIGTVPLFSVAIGELIPRNVLGFLRNFANEEKKIFGYPTDVAYNSTEYYQSLANHVDQFAVMAYDTSLKDPGLYKWFMEQQVIYVTRAVPNRDVFIGIPSYADERPNFDSKVENIENALHGVVQGLNNFRSDKDAFVGVAVYAFWETDEEEWKTYRDLWLGEDVLDTVINE